MNENAVLNFPNIEPDPNASPVLKEKKKHEIAIRYKADSLRQALEASGMRPAQFARHYGILSSTLSTWLKLDDIPGYVEALCAEIIARKKDQENREALIRELELARQTPRGSAILVWIKNEAQLEAFKEWATENKFPNLIIPAPANGKDGK